MNTERIKYPARVVHRLGQYPEKYCARCGRRMFPKLYGKARTLEALPAFKLREHCSRACAVRGRNDLPVKPSEAIRRTSSKRQTTNHTPVVEPRPAIPPIAPVATDEARENCEQRVLTTLHKLKRPANAAAVAYRADIPYVDAIGALERLNHKGAVEITERGEITLYIAARAA